MKRPLFPHLSSLVLGSSVALGALLMIASSAWAMDADVAAATLEAEKFDREYRAAQDVMRARMTKMRESKEYREASEQKDYRKTNQLTREIALPFRDEWRARMAEVTKPFADTEAELLLAAAELRHHLAPDRKARLTALVERHAASPHLSEIAKRLYRYVRPFDDGYRAMLGTIIEKNPDPTIRAHAYYARYSELTKRTDSPEDLAQAEKDLAQVLALAPEDTLLGLKARGPEFVRTRLQIGMTAPDIVGTDIQGEAFKLSDYRGKVIMLDFWGDW